ncbi:hypothetical protein JCM8097_001613 [Rhodosporidiobolus ruineniae]
MSGFDLNKLIYYAKKAFTLYKKFKKHQNQQNQQQGHQQQGGYNQQQGYGQQQQQQGAWGQQGQSPYPQTQYQQPQQQSAWQNHGQVQQQQGGKVHGGYGAHNGPATARQRLPREMVELVVAQAGRVEADRALLHRRWRLTPCFPLPSLPSLRPLPAAAFASTAFLGLASFRTFSSSALSPYPRRPPRPTTPFYDPSTRFTYPSHLSSPPPPPKPPPTLVPPPAALIPLTVFASLPASLRPSYRTILKLIGWDRLVAGIEDRQNQDMANAQNSHYVELRNQAIREGDLMAKSFASSKQAYASGNGGAAHDLSQEGKQHQRNKDRYNAEAAEWIYRENNRTQPAGSIDLHGLYVQEAIDYTEKAIQDARQRGLAELRVIVGKGNHSPSHVAKIKPAITSLMARENLTAHLDPHNGGVLVVQLQGQGGGRGAGEFVREMEGSRENDCVVM